MLADGTLWGKGSLEVSTIPEDLGGRFDSMFRNFEGKAKLISSSDLGDGS